MTRWAYTGVTSPPRRCLRSHVFDGLLASKRGTARLGTRTIQQHCINVPSKWTLSLFGWAQRPSHTPTRPSIFASKNPCPLDCPRLCLLASSLLLLPCLGRGALGCGLHSGGGAGGGSLGVPAGSPGAIVAISDYARNFSTYNFTICFLGHS